MRVGRQKLQKASSKCRTGGGGGDPPLSVKVSIFLTPLPFGEATSANEWGAGFGRLAAASEPTGRLPRGPKSVYAPGSIGGSWVARDLAGSAPAGSLSESPCTNRAWPAA